MEINEFIELMLEEKNLEELLEMFDITPTEAFECLFNGGLIDEELLNQLRGIE